ncbi:hypothetical protein GCM10009668_27700 [Nocardioides dubius]|uniref:Uncharacterized protein n=1 Tax=Nocardioides dubius TaxID=317019 RepID=A0ABN1TX08_9ACTN
MYPQGEDHAEDDEEHIEDPGELAADQQVDDGDGEGGGSTKKDDLATRFGAFLPDGSCSRHASGYLSGARGRSVQVVTE